MFLREILLRNFRNYDALNLTFDSWLNIFIGRNAQGKTNLLEAISCLATGSSFRTHRDDELFYWEEDEYRLKAEIERSEGTVDIEIRNSRSGTKIISVDGSQLNRFDELLGHINVVVFSPEDLRLIKGGPSNRRSFLNNDISQVSSGYHRHLSEYKKALYQRNTLLKRIRDRNLKTDLLNVWDEQIAEHGSYLIHRRVEVINNLEPFAKNIHQHLTGNSEILTIHYQSRVTGCDAEERNEIKDSFTSLLEDNRDEEISRGVTLFGPQRDDLVIEVNGKDLRKFGSQGQQRTAALALRLSELEFMRSEQGEYPLLLLDDVFSELDSRRGRFLLDLIADRIQTFVTTTEQGPLDTFDETGAFFTVKDGKIFKSQKA